MHYRRALKGIRRLTTDDFKPRGSTALLDAIGHSVTRIAKHQTELTEDQLPEQTVVIIITDGMENNSHIFTYEQIKKMISKQTKEYGWNFLYLGADIDAKKTASMVAINASRVANYRSDKTGTKLNYEVIEETLHKIRKEKKIFESWKDKIKHDYNHKK